MKTKLKTSIDSNTQNKHRNKHRNHQLKQLSPSSHTNPQNSIQLELEFSEKFLAFSIPHQTQNQNKQIPNQLTSLQ
jgi:hypothetical protein